MFQCRVFDGTTVAKFAETRERLMDCAGRARRPWKVVHFGAKNRVSKLVKDAIGFMTMPGNYYLAQEKIVSPYPREMTHQRIFNAIGKKWPDLICLDIPHTFGYVERFFTEEVWARIRKVFGDIPVLTFDMHDDGSRTPMLPDNFLRKSSTIHFKREPWEVMEDYPEDLPRPVPVWLGPSCQIFEPVPWKDRSWDLFFWCNNTSRIRTQILEAFRESKFWGDSRSIIYLENYAMNPSAQYILHEYGEKTIKAFAYPMIPYEVFGRIVSDCKIVCAPEGFGQFTHRHVEGLLSGAAVISTPSFMDAQVPLTEAFFVAHVPEEWPVCAEELLFKMDQKTLENSLKGHSIHALLYYSVPGFSRYLGDKINARLRKKS